jgi:glutathione S-transferase
MQTLPLVSLVILLTILEFMVLGGLVGRARGKYGIKAPATSGNEIFERHFRVHYNTLEKLVVFLPAVWLFGSHISDLWGAILGAVFIVGRAFYAYGYVREPGKREVGEILTLVAVAPLVLGALYGVIRQIID